MSTIIQVQPAYTRTPVGATDVEIPLKYLRDTRGSYITAMPSGVLLLYATIAPKSPNNQEIISFSGIRDDGNNRVTLLGVVRNISPVPPFVPLAANVPHGNNTEIILSNNPPVYKDFTTSNEDATINAIYTFTQSPIVPTPTTPTQAVPKQYVDTKFNDVDTRAVHKTGDEQIDGNKEFKKQIIIPKPTEGNHAVDYATVLELAFTASGLTSGFSSFEVTYDKYERVRTVYDVLTNKLYTFAYRTKEDKLPYLVDNGQNFVLLSFDADLLIKGNRL